MNLTANGYEPPFEGALTERERAVLFETFVSHQAMARSVIAMRENANLAVVQRCISAEHFLHCIQINRDSLKMASEIAAGALRTSRVIERNLRTLCDRGVHYRGLSDAGAALVVVRR